MDGLPVVLVLAAGAGSRFGGHVHKLLQPVVASTSVIAATLRHVAQSGLPWIVITRELIAREISQAAMRAGGAGQVVVLDEEAAQRGIGHSIARGVSESAQACGWLVVPGDMPLIRPATLQAVAEPLCEHPIAYAQYQGRRGHPVGFNADLFSDLVRLDGDEGARRLIARYPALPVDVNDPGILMDVDTAPDLLAAGRALALGETSLAPTGAGTGAAAPPG